VTLVEQDPSRSRAEAMIDATSVDAVGVKDNAGSPPT
jgi:hypothetical protein